VFFAVERDFTDLLDAMFRLEGGLLYEEYSRNSTPARAFGTSAEALAGLGLGTDVAGTGHATQCALWLPAVMPRPHIKRIDMVGGSWRETVQGCGLIWLRTGGRHESEITESTIGWFTEKAAQQMCSVEPGPDQVNWEAHKESCAFLTKAMRSLTAAKARKFPVLTHASAAHSAGAKLLHGMGVKEEVRVDAA